MQETRKLATAVPFSFKISALEQMDLQPFESYLHDGVLLIDDLEGGLSLTIAVTEQHEDEEEKKYDMDVSVKQRR